MKIKKLPNIITMMRIVFSPILLFINPLTPLFLLIYVICGLSDALDGYLARRSGATSHFGATLDSIADTIFFVIILVVFIPRVKIPSEIAVWILGIALIRLVSLAIGFYKYHGFAFLHTYANKITGLVLFCFPLLYFCTGIIITSWFICICASICAIEELLINLISKKLALDIKSIFHRN
ncbi:CDP-alcohol phosphatidyltransferase family protein [[Clostridium] fimetarium]|uniref:Phosphatidylglycerophosphate synthase n=1 Tax=[Clostridium] fimetarium TaxID=99656 RepID=A0A1I0PLQ6_9FIRM|nr:CDP-alcohol phosphatidyltransferase family protein [[Clostridium] fimetarium]SEW15263.1 CDP-diacylglycerol--glycerol-3-phosphate 3-phosphatidyltransferase [[Clostridium] fimetarium]